MSEQRQLLADSVGQVFAAIGPDADFATAWVQIEALGLRSLFLPEEEGGFGGGWADALIVFKLAGRHAVALPAVEALLAAGAAPDEPGIGSIAPEFKGLVTQDRFTGVVQSVPWGRSVQYVLAGGQEDGASLLLRTADAEALETRLNLAGEPRDDLRFLDAPCRRVRSPRDLIVTGALARAGQIAGALEAALEQSVHHVNGRVQFGKPLAKFQVVQQSLATFAAEAAAASAAAAGACAAFDRGGGALEAAAAKLRANMAAGVGATVAHQVHGAIGFTKEHPLHHWTQRLSAWRSEFGADARWAELLGAMALSHPPEDFWANLVVRSDPSE